jgi:hypothetical protein
MIERSAWWRDKDADKGRVRYARSWVLTQGNEKGTRISRLMIKTDFGRSSDYRGPQQITVEVGLRKRQRKKDGEVKAEKEQHTDLGLHGRGKKEQARRSRETTHKEERVSSSGGSE